MLPEVNFGNKNRFTFPFAFSSLVASFEVLEYEHVKCLYLFALDLYWKACLLLETRPLVSIFNDGVEISNIRTQKVIMKLAGYGSTYL